MSPRRLSLERIIVPDNKLDGSERLSNFKLSQVSKSDLCAVEWVEKNDFKLGLLTKT